MNKGTKKILSLVFFVGLLIFLQIRFNYERQRIKNNGVVKIAQINFLEAGGAKQSDIIGYKFFYQDSIYQDTESVNNRFKVKYKSFPVIINSKDPTESELLISEDQFTYYGFSCPDSIKALSIK